jgi:hypothetical protein
VPLLVLFGCAGPPIDVDLASAKETFKQRQLSNSNPAPQKTEPSKSEGAAASDKSAASSQAAMAMDRSSATEGERRRLVQFKYGEKSLSDSVFSSYLRNHSQNFSQDGRHSASAWTSEEKAARRRLLILGEMKLLRTELQSYGAPVRSAGDQLPASEVNYRGAPVATVFTSLAEKAAVPIRFSDGIRKSRLRISGMFYGDPVEVMDQIARLHRLAVRTEQSGGMFHLFTMAELDQNPGLAAGLNDPFSSVALSNAEHQVVSQYRYIVSLLESGDEANFRKQIEAVRPPQVGISATHAYEALSRGSIRLYSLLRKFDSGSLGENDHPSMAMASDRATGQPGAVPQNILALGRFEPKLCPGAEEATEKVAILYELPANVKTFVESYFRSGAAQPGAASPQAGATNSAQAAGQTPVGGAQPQPAVSAVNPPSVAPTAGGASVAGGSPSATGSAACTAQRPPLRVLDDPTGVVLTGSPYELDLAFRLIRDRDIPSRQVLAEVFLVEVQKDWERVIEASLRGKNANAGAVTSVFSVLANTATGSRGAQLKPNMGSSDIVAFINLLETNSVGRNISSPTIIARDGEKADLEKKVQLRKKVVKSTQTNNGGATVITTDERIDSLEVPLKLSLTPKVNRHNNHVVFLFEYDETILSAEAADSPIEKSTTQNKIKTNVETAPGDVVILAGLFKESNNRANSAIPGFSEMGILTPLLGGSHNRSTSSSELLVFIKPTVIEPKAFTAQVNSLR